jgi:hypothetical protein
MQASGFAPTEEMKRNEAPPHFKFGPDKTQNRKRSFVKTLQQLREIKRDWVTLHALHFLNKNVVNNVQCKMEKINELWVLLYL